MKDLINYLVPRTLVITAMLLALKMTVWPTMSLPISVASCFEPVWKATTALKLSVTQPATSRHSNPVVESGGSLAGNGTAAAETFTIEICPAGSVPKRPIKPAHSVANRTNGQSPSEATTTTSKPSRVAASKLP